jgi:hypothetical protein
MARLTFQIIFFLESTVQFLHVDCQLYGKANISELIDARLNLIFGMWNLFIVRWD